MCPWDQAQSLPHARPPWPLRAGEGFSLLLEGSLQSPNVMTKWRKKCRLRRRSRLLRQHRQRAASALRPVSTCLSGPEQHPGECLRGRIPTQRSTEQNKGRFRWTAQPSLTSARTIGGVICFRSVILLYRNATKGRIDSLLSYNNPINCAMPYCYNNHFTESDE